MPVSGTARKGSTDSWTDTRASATEHPLQRVFQRDLRYLADQRSQPGAITLKHLDFVGANEGWIHPDIHGVAGDSRHQREHI